MRRMFDRLGQATGVFPPGLVDSSDEDELAHQYPSFDSDSDSDINSEPQSLKMVLYTSEHYSQPDDSVHQIIIRTGEGMQV